MIIDKPYVIDRETVKQLLQITGTTYDTLIDLYLPVVSEDIELICQQSFVHEYKGTLTLSSSDISDIVLPTVYKGWLVSTSQYTQAKITDADITNYILRVDQQGTATSEKETVLINQFPIGKRVVASQMIAFMINKNNGINSVNNGAVKSKSLPPLSVTYDSSDNSLHSGYGYPMYIVSSLQQVKKPRFI